MVLGRRENERKENKERKKDNKTIFLFDWIKSGRKKRKKLSY